MKLTITICDLCGSSDGVQHYPHRKERSCAEDTDEAIIALCTHHALALLREALPMSGHVLVQQFSAKHKDSDAIRKAIAAYSPAAL